MKSANLDIQEMNVAFPDADKNVSQPAKFLSPVYTLTEQEKLTVYDPSEDTFLLLDALEKEYEHLKVPSNPVCVEVGCGSGVVSIFLAKILKSRMSLPFVICTDLNRDALSACRRNASENGVCVHTVRTNLLDSIKDRLKGQVDILLFNPPYVPTDEKLPEDDYLAKCYAGGASGLDCFERLIPEVHRLLSQNGRFYLVALHSNNIKKLLAWDNRLQCSIVMERKCGIERLYILKFTLKGYENID